jgi:hypothetical protein
MATTRMNIKDWQTTRFDTNLAEAAHAYSQRDGIKLSLLAAVQRAQRIDHRFFQLEYSVCRFGVNSRYGNRSLNGRKKLAVTRKKAKVAKQALRTKEVEIVGETEASESEPKK